MTRMTAWLMALGSLECVDKLLEYFYNWYYLLGGKH